jgi:hypothetical protein
VQEWLNLRFRLPRWWLVPDEPDLPGVIAEQRELLARLREVVEAKDAEAVMLRAELAAARSGSGGWSCESRNWSGGWGRIARRRGRRRRRT